MEISDKMKFLVRPLIHRTARNAIGWSLYRTCGLVSDCMGRIYRHAQFVRQSQEIEALAADLCRDLTVAHGPFKGLRYPSAQSFGSLLLPKLLGAYESELHTVLDQLLSNDYTTVVDIGCAEGYYAIGLALRLKHSQGYAFDTNSKAKNLCAQMAKLNGVSDRIHIGDLCNADRLRSIPLGDRALILSDCEGYEGTLFNREMAKFLAKHDLIIETHDFIDMDLSEKMRDAFCETHHIRSIKSLDDIEKAHTKSYLELNHYTTRDKYLILREGRPAIMEWLVMTSKEEGKQPVCNRPDHLDDHDSTVASLEV
jgi:hypothetical protein